MKIIREDKNNDYTMEELANIIFDIMQNTRGDYSTSTNWYIKTIADKYGYDVSYADFEKAWDMAVDLFYENADLDELLVSDRESAWEIIANTIEDLEEHGVVYSSIGKYLQVIKDNTGSRKVTERDVEKAFKVAQSDGCKLAVDDSGKVWTLREAHDWFNEVHDKYSNGMYPISYSDLNSNEEALLRTFVKAFGDTQYWGDTLARLGE